MKKLRTPTVLIRSVSGGTSLAVGDSLSVPEAVFTNTKIAIANSYARVMIRIVLSLLAYISIVERIHIVFVYDAITKQS